jgi:uncharacterized protein
MFSFSNTTMNKDYQFQISDEHGLHLVKMSRLILENYQSRGKIITLENNQNLIRRFGVFVTLYNVDEFDKFSLRGCIGYAMPSESLAKSLVNASIKAANEDPRFDPVTYNELQDIVIEVSILSPPILIAVENIQSKILIGKHGLIIESPSGSGLLLPNVAFEKGWEVMQFLEYLCYKAGLASSSWMSPDIRLFSFETIIFREKAPGGEIIRLRRTTT